MVTIGDDCGDDVDSCWPCQRRGCMESLNKNICDHDNGVINHTKVKPWRKVTGRDIGCVGVGKHWPCQRRDCKEFLLSTPAGSAPSALQLRPHILSLKFLSEYFLAHIPFALHKTTKQHRWHFWGWSDKIRLIQWDGSQWNKDSSQEMFTVLPC